MANSHRLRIITTYLSKYMLIVLSLLPDYYIYKQLLSLIVVTITIFYTFTVACSAYRLLIRALTYSTALYVLMLLQQRLDC